MAGLVVAALVGCTGPSAPPHDAASSQQAVHFEDLALPSELAAPRDVTSAWRLVPATAGRPTLAASIRTAPGGKPTVGLWTGTATGTYERLDVDLGLSGSVESLELAADAETAVLIGSQWDGNRLSSFARTSTDRITWTELELPGELDGVSWQGAVAADGRTVAVAEDWQDSTVVAVVAGDTVRTLSVPDVVADASRDVLGVAAHGKEIAVLAAVTPAAEASSDVMYRSVDDGATWDAATSVTTSALEGAAGVAWTGAAYVVTGWARTASETDEVSRAVAWSGDGSGRWDRADVLAPIDEADYQYDEFGTSRADRLIRLVGTADHYPADQDTWLGAPSVDASGRVTAVLAARYSMRSWVVRREGSGSWTSVAQSGDLASLAVTGRAVAESDGSTAVVLATDGGATFDRVTSAGDWRRQGLASAPDEVYGVTRLGLDGDDVRISASMHVFAQTSDGWQSHGEPLELRYQGDQVVAVSDDPPAVESASVVTRGFDAGSGSTVLVAMQHSSEPGGEAASVWFRAARGRDWQQGSGLGDEQAIHVSELARTGSGWVASGNVRPDTRPATPLSQALWTSVDGLTWARVTDALVPDDAAGGVQDVCALPDGRPLAVGEITSADGRGGAVVWTESGGTWSHQEIETGGAAVSAGPGATSSAYECTTVGGAVVVQGLIGDRDVDWRTTDGRTFTREPQLPRGQSRDAPLAVAGGLVATGQVSDKDGTGPVLWLSTDGTAWTYVRVPTRTSTQTLWVEAHGDDLLVVASTAGGHQAWVVRDSGQVIARVTASER